MINNKKDLATIIAAFLNKYKLSRDSVTISGYEFIIDAFIDVSISQESICVLHDDSVRFKGYATIYKHDSASNVHTYDKVNFFGTAFFASDPQGDSILYKASINQIKQFKV